jgi:hypothetical protein
VEIPELAHGAEHDHAIVSIHTVRAQVEPEAELEEGEEAAEEAPAADEEAPAEGESEES